MAVETVRPVATIADTGWTVVDTSAHAAMSDDSDATWVENDAPTSGDLSALDVTMGAPTLPAGARIAAVRLRRRWSIDDSGDPGLMRNRVRPGGGEQWLTWDRTTNTFDAASGILDSQSQWWSEKPSGGIWTADDVDALTVRSATNDVEVRLYELFADVEYNVPPVVTLAGPSSPVTDTTRPQVIWGYTDADGDPQDAYGIRVYTSDQEPGGGWPADPFDLVGEPVWASGTVLSSGRGATIPVDLDDGVSYRVYLRARQDLYGLWSAWVQGTFTVDLDGPDAPTVTVTGEPGQAHNRLELSDPVSSDPAADWFDVEFRDGEGGGLWSPLRSGRQVPVIGSVLYWEGAFADDWVAGISLRTGSRAKEATRLLVEAGDATGTADWAWVTDDPVDLTGVSELRVDWAAQRTGLQARAALIASTSKAGSWNNFAARLAQPADFSRQVDTIDVSGLSGHHYLRVHAIDNNGSAANGSEVSLYGLALDQDPGPAPPSVIFDHEVPLQQVRQYRARGVAEVSGLAVAGDATVTDPVSLGAPSRWLTDVAEPGRLHVQLKTTGHQRRQQGRDVIHRPVGMDTVTVESEPPYYMHDFDVVTLTAEQEAQLREAVRSRRPLIFRDRRQSLYVRIVGDVNRRQESADEVNVDRWSLSTVEVDPPEVALDGG